MKNIKAILVIALACIAVILILFIPCDIRLPYLSCSQWIQPFLTVMALLIATLLVWAQFWKQNWYRLNKWQQLDTNFSVALVTAWIFSAILFSLIALVSAVWSCSTCVNQICPWSTAFATTAVFMTFALVIHQLIGTTYVILWGHLGGEPIIGNPYGWDKFCWCLAFSAALIGLFVISISLTGVITNAIWLCISRWIGKLLVALAISGYARQYTKSL
jgi:hypothetical protein